MTAGERRERRSEWHGVTANRRIDCHMGPFTRRALATAIGLVAIGCSSLLGDGYYLATPDAGRSSDAAPDLDAFGPQSDGASDLDAGGDAVAPCTVGTQRCQGTGAVLTCESDGGAGL
jgi:hypothetical protein